MQLGFWTLAETGHELLVNRQQKCGPMWIAWTSLTVDTWTWRTTEAGGPMKRVVCWRKHKKAFCYPHIYISICIHHTM
jgi:hypothetical protein